MKQFKLVVKSICSVLLLWMLFSSPVDARASIIGNVVNDGQDYVGRIIVITDARPTTGGACGFPFDDYNCVIINPSSGPATVTICGINPNESVKAGDRFDIISQVECNGHLFLQLERK